jgi:hypothetical protein
MTYKQPSQEAAWQRSLESSTPPKTVVGAVTYATVWVGQLAIQGELFGDSDTSYSADHEQTEPIPAIHLNTHTTDGSTSETQPKRPTFDDLLAQQRSVNALERKRTRRSTPELINAWRELDHAIANHLFGMSPQEYEKCRTEATEQFYAIVAYRRKVRDAAKTTHPSQTAAQHSNRPERSARERFFSPQDAAAGEYVVRPKLPKTPKKLDY